VQARIVKVIVLKSGVRARRAREVDITSIRIGRATDNTITLNDLTVPLHHSTLHLSSDGVTLKRDDATELLVNDAVVETALMAPGDQLRVGQFELRLLEPEGDEAIALEVEKIDLLGDEREELALRSQIGIESGWLRRRWLSWALLVAIVLFFFARPLLTGDGEGSWNSGTISRKHAFIANDCDTCHSSFERVKNDGCLDCHGDISHHTMVDLELEDHGAARCAACHIEHTGALGLAALGEPLCVSCHANIQSIHPESALAAATNFETDHPEFRLALVTDPGSGEPERVPWRVDLRENSGVAFSHFRHVGQAVPDPEGENAPLRCDTCHVVDAGGARMEPIAFEEHCQRCHSLEFDEAFAGVQALHGPLEAVRTQFGGLYAAGVLKGDFAQPEEPEFIRFLRPGQELKAEQAKIVDAWVEEKVADAVALLIDENGECARCHEIIAADTEGDLRRVAPVQLADTWMPLSTFRHYTHRPFPCRDCHARTAVYDPDDEDAVTRPTWSLSGLYELVTPDELLEQNGLTPSTEASDQALPGIADCRPCHGDGSASPPLVASDCVLCHRYHNEGFGTMHDLSPGIRSEETSEHEEMAAK
jgi:hypothetical protein